MQAKVRLSRLDPLGAQLPQQQGQMGQRPQYAGFLATFVPSEVPADGTATGDMHLTGMSPVLTLAIGPDQANKLRIGGDYTLSIADIQQQ